LRAAEVERLFRQRLGAKGKTLLARYGRTWLLPAHGGGLVQVTITQAHAMRLALKFHDSLHASAELYCYCREKLGERPFSWEIALDETAALTTPREALFYLLEWQALGFTCEYLGPNVGFAKRVDYTGSLAALARRVRQQDAIVRGLAAGLLSIHSGDGAHPYSGKGPGTYEAILAGCGGDCKFKISDIYYELLMEHLAALPSGSRGRKLFEAIFDAVEAYLREQVASGGPLVTPLLLRQIAEYDEGVRHNPDHRCHPRADFFRFNEFLSLNMRDEAGRRTFREGLLRFAREHDDFRAAFNEAVEALTLRMIDGLKLADKEA
ncbi:MAG: tagaturonate epimerase family protein, partial [Armatimonadota bacterium]